MTWYNMWIIIAWSMLGIIVIGCIVLMYLMYADALARRTRNIAAPLPGGARNSGKVFESSEDIKAGVSRRERRNTKLSKGKINVQSSDRSSLWNGDEDFDITNGKD